jgi:hypothetical protein
MFGLKYKPAKLTTAQALLVRMGLDDLRLVSHHGDKQVSFRKTGPGRRPVIGNGGGTKPRKIAYGRGLENHFEQMRREAFKARAAKRMAAY